MAAHPAPAPAERSADAELSRRPRPPSGAAAADRAADRRRRPRPPAAASPSGRTPTSTRAACCRSCAARCSRPASGWPGPACWTTPARSGTCAGRSSSASPIRTRCRRPNATCCARMVAERSARREAYAGAPLISPASLRRGRDRGGRPGHRAGGELRTGHRGRCGWSAGPEDFGRLQPGEVLVCPFTNPAWTPLFQVAVAAVVDTGQRRLARRDHRPRVRHPRGDGHRQRDRRPGRRPAGRGGRHRRRGARGPGRGRRGR